MSLLLASLAGVGHARASDAPAPASAATERAGGLPGPGAHGGEAGASVPAAGPSARGAAGEHADGEDAHPELADAPQLAADSVALPPVPSRFSVHDAGWIVFAYPPDARARIQPLIDASEEMRADLRERLGQEVLGRLHVRVGRTTGEMADLAPEGAPAPEYAAGVAYAQLRLVLLSLEPRYPGEAFDVKETFHHELAHIALSDAVGGRRVPRWFNEGFAIQASGESSLERLQSLWTATVSDTLIPLSELERRVPSDPVGVSVAYAQAGDVVRFLQRGQDRARFQALVARLRQGQTFDAALVDSYGVSLAELELEWREDLAKRYTFWPILFSGTTIWAVALLIFGLAWRRKRLRERATLARWDREDAARAALRAAQEATLALAPAAPPPATVPPATVPPAPLHVVLRPGGTSAAPPQPTVRKGVANDVPVIEHRGGWHTLH